jgi:hypothetical protein
MSSGPSIGPPRIPWCMGRNLPERPNGRSFLSPSLTSMPLANHVSNADPQEDEAQADRYVPPF